MILGNKFMVLKKTFLQLSWPPQLIITGTAEFLNQSKKKKKIHTGHINRDTINKDIKREGKRAILPLYGAAVSAASRLRYKLKSFYFVIPLVRQPLSSPFVPGSNALSKGLRRRDEVEGFHRSGGTVMKSDVVE